MTMTVDELLTAKVRVLLRDTDEGGILWGDAELIMLANEACLEVARIRPAASSSTMNLSPVAGALQSLPDGGIMMLEIVCNHNNGVEGRVVRRAERADLDNEMPNWRSSTKKSVALRYSASTSDPSTFHVYPPSTGAADAGLVVVASVEPTKVTALTDLFPLEAIYSGPVANYVLFRAFMKLVESDAAQKRAADFLQLFNSQMGISDKSFEGRNATQRQPVPR